MILNIGGRTDIPQYYAPWLLRRFEEGYVLSRNPLFPEKVTRYELTPDKVDGMQFCSKNYAPLLPRLHEIADRFNTYFHYTITAYGSDVEPGVPSPDRSVDTLLDLERIVGTRRIAWRYDPVMVVGRYTVERHLETFEHLASRLAGHVDRCIFSFVELYQKLARNMPELREVTPEERERLAQGLGSIAAQHGLRIQTCADGDDYTRFGIERSGCMTLDIMGRANGVQFRRLKHRGMRANCNCIETRDIGAYNCCPNRCRYCYANADPVRAVENWRTHDPASPLLLGHVREGDVIQQGDQRSWLVPAPAQPSLF